MVDGSPAGGATAADGSTPAMAGVVAGVASAGSVAAVVAGVASSMMTCALVPLTPNEDTAARRGRPARSGHTTGSVSSRAFPALQSTCGEGAST